MKVRAKNSGATAGTGVFQHLSSASEILLAGRLADFDLPSLPSHVQVKSSKVLALELAGVTQLPPLPTNDNSEFVPIEFGRTSFSPTPNFADNGSNLKKAVSLGSQALEFTDQPLKDLTSVEPIDLLNRWIDVDSSVNDLTPLVARKTRDTFTVPAPWPNQYIDGVERSFPYPSKVNRDLEVEVTEIVEESVQKAKANISDIKPFLEPNKIGSTYTFDITQPESLLEKVARASTSLEWQREQQVISDQVVVASPPLVWGCRSSLKLFYQIMVGEPWVAWEWSSVIAMILAKSLGQKDVIWPGHSDSRSEIVKKVYSNLKHWHLQERKVAPKLPNAHCALQIVWLQNRFREIFSNEYRNRGDCSK